MLNCQTKKLTDAPFQGFVHMTFKHRPPGRRGKEPDAMVGSTGRKKVIHLLCVCTVWCMWMKAISERTLDLLSAACPLIKTGDKLACQN